MLTYTKFGNISQVWGLFKKGTFSHYLRKERRGSWKVLEWKKYFPSTRGAFLQLLNNYFKTGLCNECSSPMRKQTHKMSTEIYDFVMNGHTTHIHVGFCQCPFPLENLKTNSCFSHPPVAEHMKRMKARRVEWSGWSLEKDEVGEVWRRMHTTSGFSGVLWCSVSLTSIKLTNVQREFDVQREFCVVTLRELSELMKLNLRLDVALYVQKWVNESWQLPEVSALKKCTDEKCKLKGDLKMLFRTQADPTLMGKRRWREYGRLLQRMTKRISLMEWAEGRRVNGRMKDCSDYTQCCRRTLDEY